MSNLVLWNEQPSTLSLFDAMNRLFQESVVLPATVGAFQHVPPMDVYETEDSYTVELAVPGLKPDQFDVSLQQNTLLIGGKFTQADSEARYLLRERNGGDFTRTLQFPVPVDAEKIQAELTNGILVVRVPKSEAAKPQRIAVRSA
jgi:HSP20 family protein